MSVRRCPDQGQATIVVAGALVLVGLSAVGVARLGGRAADAAQARSAADAAALAAVSGGEASAVRIARANGAEVVSVVIESSGGGTDATVVVRVDGAVATARASDLP